MNPTPDRRSEDRSNVFLAATLDSGAATFPVRIRNLSAHGVLVEGALLPPIGTSVRLARGELEALGQLAWASGRHGGINFANQINVERWVKRVGHAGQHQVDGIVAALRASGELPCEVKGPTGLNTVADVSSALDKVCEDLAATPNMSIELGEKLLRLDSIAQALRRLATGKPF